MIFKRFTRIILCFFCLIGVFAIAKFSHNSYATGIINTDSDLGIFRDLSNEEIKEYYDDSISVGDKGDTLLTKLQGILKTNQVKLKYDSGNTTSKSWDGYYLLDRDWDKSPLTETEKTSQTYAKTDIWMNILYSTNSIYIEDSINKGNFKYYDSTNTLTSIAYKNGGAQFDREHVLPKSFGFNGASERYKDLTAGCDMQNLHAGEHVGNSIGHSNYPFGTVVSKTEDTKIVSAITKEVIGYTGENKDGIKVFEPLDIDKGDIARTIFYMCARYHKYEELGDNDNTPAITLSNAATSMTTMEPEDTKDSPAAYGELDDLLSWNKIDPVDDFEIHRNNLCYNAVQKNRNPFIDFPEWANVAYGTSSIGVDLNTIDGLENPDRLNVTTSILNIYKNEMLDMSKFICRFKNIDNSMINLDINDLTYEVYFDDVKLEVEKLDEFVFDKYGDYIIKFIYHDAISSLDYYFNYTLQVKKLYQIKINNLGDIKVKYEEGDTLDLSNMIVNLIYKDNNISEINDQTIIILDSDGNEVSTDINYKFNKRGNYTIMLNYEKDNELCTTSFDVSVKISKIKLIIIIAIVVVVLIISLVVFITISKKKKKRNHTNTNKTTSRRKK